MNSKYLPLREGRNNNPAHKQAFNSRIYDLKKKNPNWNRTSVDDDLTARTLFTEVRRQY